MRIGILTGGGDCPGLNAVIRAAVRSTIVEFDGAVVGFRDGWRGVMANDYVMLDVESCRGILPRGGTILGTSRDQPYAVDGGVDQVRAAIEEHRLDAIVSIGGEGTMGVIRDLHRDGVPVVGVPKTIDNDIAATEMTFGFQTAVQICTDAIDRLHTTAESHDRILVVEVMGRHVGHIAVWAGIAGGATFTLVPEEPFDLDDIAKRVVARHRNGKWATIIVVAEGAVPVEGTLEMPTWEQDTWGHAVLGGIGNLVAREMKDRTGMDTRTTILGHVQRGGSPVAFDRVLGTRFGIAAAQAVDERDFGKMVALQFGNIVRVPVEEAVGELKMVDPALLHDREVFHPPRV